MGFLTCQHDWIWTGGNPRKICSKCGAIREDMVNPDDPYRTCNCRRGGEGDEI